MWNIQLLLLSSLIAGSFSMLSGCTTSSKHVSEISGPNVPHIAMLRRTRFDGTVVVYNSEICKQIGEACDFFRSQTFAHTQLNHPILTPEYQTRSNTRDADCWAATYAEPSQVAAAFALLMDADRVKDLPIVGDPESRAANIQTCAKQAGNWPDNA